MAERGRGRATGLGGDLDKTTVCRMATNLGNGLPACFFLIADTHDGPLRRQIEDLAIWPMRSSSHIRNMLCHKFVNKFTDRPDVEILWA